MSDFKREERYIVVKLKDIDTEETQALREFLKSWQIPTRECVVVEPDWPNYEDTWKAVEQVSNGKYESPYDLIEQQQARITELELQVRSVSLSRDELAATVERLKNKDIGSFLYELSSNYDGDWSYSSIEEFALSWEQRNE